MMSWKTFLARTLVATVAGGGALTLAIFVGTHLAAADPGGPTRDALTYAGVLRMPPATPTPLVFEFRRAGATCSVTTSPVMFDSSGVFSVEVPILCPGAGGRGFFNGDGVTYAVRLGSASGELLTPTPITVTPVPYARFADQVGVNNDCPVGYERDPAATPGTVCVRILMLGSTALRDEVVRVGRETTAFWIDRYEAAVHHSRTGAQLGTANDIGGGDDNIASSGLSRSGQRAAGDFPALALSHAALLGTPPFVGRPTVNVTWFQANEACRASGKRLPTGSEWLAAATGTEDNSARCAISTGGARASSRDGRCTSASGAHDMIGNVWEWTDEWYAGVGNDARDMTLFDQQSAWPSPDYNDDRTWNIRSAAHIVSGGPRVPGAPSAAIRGGGWGGVTTAGIFALGLNASPSRWNSDVGFRCVIPR